MRFKLLVFYCFFTSFPYSFTLQAKTFTVEIYKKQYIPSKITINQGDTVIWINIEKRQYHNVWFKKLFKEEPDYFFPDERFEMTFNENSHFPYECGAHPKMKGLVIVVESTIAEVRGTEGTAIEKSISEQ